MAGKAGYPLGGVASPGIYVVPFSFVTAGASAPSVVRGAKVSVGTPSTGVYTVTLTDKFVAIVSAQISLAEQGTGSNDAAYIDEIDVDAGTITIVTQSAAGTDANLTGPEVHVVLYCRNTTVTK